LKRDSAISVASISSGISSLTARRTSY